VKEGLTFWRLAARSLRFYWRTHAGVLLGTAIASSALIGALLVGDSVRGSLRDRAVARVGKAELILAPGDRFLTDQTATNLLWDRTVQEVGGLKGAFPTSPGSGLILPAIATVPNGAARANGVTLIGVRARQDSGRASFWDYAPLPTTNEIGPGKVRLNDALARHLGVKRGDTILFRTGKPSALSAESPVSPRSGQSAALRLKFDGVVPDSSFGGFSTTMGQRPRMNAFVNLAELQTAAGLEGRCNLLLVPSAVSAEGHGARLPSSATLELASKAFRQSWRL